MDSVTASRLDELVQRLQEMAPTDEARMQNTLKALREEISRAERDDVASAELLEKYREAYDKLTAPANRLGVFLEHLENGRVLLALGETEYVALYDPEVKPEQLVTGVRVGLNEAYAVVTVLPPHEGGDVMSVSEVLDSGRLRVARDAQGSAHRLVYRGAGIAESKIEKGDSVRIDPSGRVALEHFIKEDTKDYFVEEVPETPWEAIGGQHEAIRLIRETIEHPLLYPDLYAKFDKKPIKGVLLYGPPGCGKTMIGKAIAYNLAKEYSERVGHEVREYFMHISGPKVLNMWLGETERMVREIFNVARNKAKEGRLVVIFMDEAEAILRTRSSGRWLNISNTVVPQFCAEMDGLVSLDNVVLVLTSNRPDYIDPAILRPERIDRKIKVTRPDKDASKDILGIYLHDRLPLDPEVMAKFGGDEVCARKELVETTLAHIWRTATDAEFVHVMMRNGSKQTLYLRDMVSGALLKSIVDRAKDFAIRRAVSEGKPETAALLQMDLTQAVDEEFKENEIFPKSDAMEDWLRLLDIEAESVASIRPVGERAGDSFMRKSVI